MFAQQKPNKNDQLTAIFNDKVADETTKQKNFVNCFALDFVRFSVYSRYICARIKNIYEFLLNNKLSFIDVIVDLKQ